LGVFVEQSATEWHRMVATNLIGTTQVTRAVFPHMIRSGGGRVVNAGSLAGKEGLAALAA
jgi:NADP-dependent 3-hydroxy acid dehydrogenase YdfG